MHLSPSRREAIELLKAGKALEAVNALNFVPSIYRTLLHHSGVNVAQSHNLRPVMAALQVLAEAFIQMEGADVPLYAMRIRADVEETEAIMAEYYKGVLEETRWELAEQRRAAAGAVVVAGSGGSTKKTKAAKRKQQKRKAQQQKKAEAAAVEATARGEEEGTQGQLEL